MNENNRWRWDSTKSKNRLNLLRNLWLNWDISTQTTKCCIKISKNNITKIMSWISWMEAKLKLMFIWIAENKEDLFPETVRIWMIHNRRWIFRSQIGFSFEYNQHFSSVIVMFSDVNLLRIQIYSFHNLNDM